MNLDLSVVYASAALTVEAVRLLLAECPANPVMEDILLDLETIRDVLDENAKLRGEPAPQMALVHGNDKKPTAMSKKAPAPRPQAPPPVEEPAVVPAPTPATAGTTVISGLTISTTIPGDSVLTRLGAPVLAAHCRYHGVRPAAGDRQSMIEALQERREALNRPSVPAPEPAAKGPPVARPGKPAAAAATPSPVHERMARSDEQGKRIRGLADMGKATLQGLLGARWTAEKASTFCSDHRLPKPSGLPEFMQALDAACRAHGIGGKVEVVVPAEEHQPEQTAQQEQPPADDLRATVEAMLKRGTLGALGQACALVPELAKVDRKDGGKMRAALTAWMGGEQAPVPAPAETKATTTPTPARKPPTPRKSDATPEEVAGCQATGLNLVLYRVLRCLASGQPMTYRQIEAVTGYYANLTATLRPSHAGSLGALGLTKEEMYAEDPAKPAKLAFTITPKGTALLAKAK